MQKKLGYKHKSGYEKTMQKKIGNEKNVVRKFWLRKYVGTKVLVKNK